MNFIEVDPEEPCWYCGRKKLSENDRFYRTFFEDNPSGVVVCEFCKVGFMIRQFEGVEKSYATHLIFYVRRSLLELKTKLPDTIVTELNHAITCYEDGEFPSGFRSIGIVAEGLTQRLFAKRFGEDLARNVTGWEDRLGRLLQWARRNKDIPEEAIVFQLFSLKWLRNQVDHPSSFKIKGEDVRLGLASIMYLLQQAYSYNLV